MLTLAIHTGGIGDFLLACPALARLAEAGPLTVAGRVERLELAVAAGVARSACDLDSMGFSTLFSEPSARLRRFVTGFDRVVVWMRDGDGRIHRAFESMNVRDIVVAPGLPPPDWNRHAEAYYLESIGYPPDPAPFRPNFGPADRSHDVIIHPGSGGHRKNWPLDRFLEVAGALRDRGRRVEWVLGPAEESLTLPRDLPRLPEMPLRDLARHLAAARLYLGNDSGITHLAAVAGCPTVAVFGPTDPRVWAPRGDRVRVVSGSPWPGADDVLRTATGSAGC